jgi:sirohydrochlorin cobaltochelatase
MKPEDRRAFEALELRIQTILPEEYQDSYDEVEPVSMGSAALKYGRDGKVAWQDIWTTFCDLAMAGGPPHKGSLLVAGSQQEIDADPDRYQLVVEEICRGIAMVTELKAAPSPVPGWIRVECGSTVTAGWLARAIVMENVSAHCEGTSLDLPARPGYRLEKEIKNVITVMAKTCHYWLDHTSAAQQREIGDLFVTITSESPLIQPAVAGHDFRKKIADSIRESTGLVPSDVSYDGWMGVVCPSVKAAIWMMRATMVSNVFARREESVMFVAMDPMNDPDGEIVAKVVARVHGFARVRGVL